jgi:trehalose 6-phosphate phosphatase
VHPVTSDLPTWPAKTALFLDLDGTLLEFADHPHDVDVGDDLLRLLRDLPSATNGAVAIVSGRRLVDLDALLSPLVLPAAGLHGLERRDAKGNVSRIDSAAASLARIRPRLRDFVAEHSGALLEDKQLALALHYRKRPDLAALVADAVARATRGDDDVVVVPGNMVVEVRSAGADKGGAIVAFMRESPFAGRTPVFIGDDVTDEDGFRVVRELGGLAVKVGPGSTNANARLEDVEAVVDWLKAFSERHEISS